MTHVTHPTRRGRHRGTATAVGAVVLSGLLTACGSLTPGSGSDSGERPKTAPSSTALPKDQNADITLKLAFADAPEMVDSLIAAFEGEHPGITIEPQYTQFSDYVKNLRLTMTSDTAPDIAQYAVGMDDLATRGEIYDLAPYRQAYGWDDDFPKVNLEQLTGGRKKSEAGGPPLYGVPAGLSMTGIYYNKELAAKAGIKGTPKTLDDFERDLAAVKKAGMTPLGVGALDSGGLHLWAALVNAMMPVEDYRDWVNGAEGGTIETKGALAASERVAEWARKGYLNDSANGTGQIDSTAQFTQGDSVFLINGNWAAGQLAEAMGDKTGFFPFPGVRESSRAVASGFSVSYAMSSRTEHPQAVGAFLDFLSSSEAARIISDNGFLPSDADAVPEPEGVLGEVARSHRRVTADEGINQFPDFTAPGMLDPLRSGVQKLIGDRVKPSEFLASLQDVRNTHHAR